MIQAAPASSDAPTPAAAVELRAVTLAHGRLVVLSRASLSVPSGGFAALIGPPGAGKTSLLRCLAGQHEPRSGEARVLGVRPLQARRRVAYVPPLEAINWAFPISVGELVMTGRYARLGLFARPSAADRARVRASLERTGLAGRADVRIAELGPVERGRALLARALAREAELILVDEPWTPRAWGDDETLTIARGEIRPVGGTIVVATAQLAAARRFDWIALLNGRVVAHGRPEEVLTAEHLGAAFGRQPVLSPVSPLSFAEDRP